VALLTKWRKVKVQSSQMTLKVIRRHFDAYLYGKDALGSITSAEYPVGDACF
jgi:hypothetical protein